MDGNKHPVRAFIVKDIFPIAAFILFSLSFSNLAEDEIRRGGIINILSFGYIVLCVAAVVIGYMGRVSDQANFYRPQIPIKHKDKIIQASKICHALPECFVENACVAKANAVIDADNRADIHLYRGYENSRNFDRIKCLIQEDPFTASEIAEQAIINYLEEK